MVMATPGRIAARRTLALVLLAVVWASAQAATVGFDEVAAILETRCTMCHAGPAAPAGLRLDSLQGLMTGSARGPVVVPGDPDASELVRRLRGQSLPRMPLTGPPFLDDHEIDLFVRWIAAGAPAGPTDGAPVPAGEPPADGPPADAPPAGPTWTTYADVQALLVGRCASCHTSQGVMGPPPEGYRLDTYEETIRATDRARVVPFDPDASELVRRILGHARPRMPFGGPYLDTSEIDLVVAWIRDGARSADGVAAPVPVGSDVRLHGTWGPGHRLDGLPIGVHGGTRFEDAVRPGAYVQVRGVIGTDGRVRAERIRIRD